jgi:hypothetical protein
MTIKGNKGNRSNNANVATLTDHSYKTLSSKNTRMIKSSYKSLGAKVHRATMCGITKNITVTYTWHDFGSNSKEPKSDGSFTTWPTNVDTCLCGNVVMVNMSWCMCIAWVNFTYATCITCVRFSIACNMAIDHDHIFMVMKVVCMYTLVMVPLSRMINAMHKSVKYDRDRLITP